MTTILPEILGMHFRPNTGDCQVARLSPDFWPIFKAERDELRQAGLTVSNDSGSWELVYNPAYDRKGSAAALLPQLETAYAAKIEEARAERAEAEHQRELEKDRQRQEREAWCEANADLIRDTFDRARALQAEWGDALHNKGLLTSMLTYRPSPRLISDMQDEIAKGERRVRRFAKTASSKRGGVDWPDHIVIRAVEVLTDLDADEGKQRNKVGWDGLQTHMGHWCNTALKRPDQREAALKLARTIVGGYIKQLAIYMPEYPGLTK